MVPNVHRCTTCSVICLNMEIIANNKEIINSKRYLIKGIYNKSTVVDAILVSLLAFLFFLS